MRRGVGRGRAGLVAVAIAAASCGGPAVFGLTSDDNNPDRLARALAQRPALSAPGPLNASGHPMLFAAVTTAGGEPRMIAFDLSTGSARWSVAADVRSRIVAGGELVVAVEGGDVVAREVVSGRPRWKHPLGGDLVGIAADATRVYVVDRSVYGARPTWRLLVRGADGHVLWQTNASGPLGAPAAQAGWVMVPFLHQWLVLLDGRSGDAVTRIRGVDDEISFVHVTSDAAFFGSSGGVFRLDDKAASGERSQSSFGQIALPAPLARAGYHPDAFDPVQAGYNAADRTCVLWRASDRGRFQFQDGRVAVHWFRFVFGLSLDGTMHWAYSHPRTDLVASAHAGTVIAAVSAGGEVIALDPVTGALRWSGRVDLAGGRVIGGTFDADGWAPAVARQPADVAAVLVSIASDRDARFDGIKEMVLGALGRLPGAEVTRELIGIVRDPRLPARLTDAASRVLIARTDPAGLPVLTEALAPITDFVVGSEPASVDVLARAIATLGGAALDPEPRRAAIDALLAHLASPATPSRDAIAVVSALAAIGGGAERGPLTSFLLVHRADPDFGGDSGLIKVVIDALAEHGGAAEREVVRFVATDGRSHDAVAGYARQVMAGTR